MLQQLQRRFPDGTPQLLTIEELERATDDLWRMFAHEQPAIIIPKWVLDYLRAIRAREMRVRNVRRRFTHLSHREFERILREPPIARPI